MNKNVGLMLKQRAVVSTNVEAYVEPSNNIRASWQDVNLLSNRCASIMKSLGLVCGQRASHMSRGTALTRSR